MRQIDSDIEVNIEKLNGLLARPIGRRGVLGVFVAGATVALFGCTERYERPGGYHDLGEVKNLLLPEQHIRDRAMLVFKDDTGWSAMSTRCTVEGCDLTYQDFNPNFKQDILVCPCCRSTFSHRGKILAGKAKIPLPFYEVSYENRHLYANSSKPVVPTYRFITPELEEAVRVLRQRGDGAGLEDRIQVPKALMGRQDNPDEINTDTPSEPATAEQPSGETTTEPTQDSPTNTQPASE